MAAALFEQLDWRQRRELDRLAPSHVTVPTGRQGALDYEGEAPVLAGKTQEVVGAGAAAGVGGGPGGRRPLSLPPARPAGRGPAAEDLAGLGGTGYAAVRAELRGRYPRHPWPEDPTTAPPTKGTKPLR